jgi:hypothetical protein
MYDIVVAGGFAHKEGHDLICHKECIKKNTIMLLSNVERFHYLRQTIHTEGGGESI